jgi:hypothetical protein
MIEAALTLPLFIILVLGMLDLGLWVFRYHIIGQTARQLAREAIVHGSLADRLGPWGPDPIGPLNCVANPAGDPRDAETRLRDIASRSVIGLNGSDVTFLVEWIDKDDTPPGNNPQVGNRVRVSVTATYEPIMTFIFGNPSVTVTGVSTMRIAH